MALSSAGAGLVTLSQAVSLPRLQAWTITFTIAPTKQSALFATSTANSNIFLGFVGDRPSIKMGAQGYIPASGDWALDGSVAYTFTATNDGTGQVTFSSEGKSTTITQDQDYTIDRFLDYNGTSFDFAGVVSGLITFTGVPGGDRSYDTSQTPGTTTLPDTLGDGSTDGTLSGDAEFIEITVDNPPTITLLGDNPLTLTQGDTFNEPGYVADDGEGNDITGSVVEGTGPDTSVVGTDQVKTYTVTDGADTTVVERQFVIQAPTSASISITSPTQYTRKARSSDRQFAVSGTITDGTGPVEYSVDGGLTWSLLDGTTGSSFSGTVTLNGVVDITVRLQGDISTTATVQDVGVAKTFLVALAQSNALGWATNFQVPPSVENAPSQVMYDAATEEFKPVSDPQPRVTNYGSQWPWFAYYASLEGEEVVIVNQAEGGTTVADWQPGGSLYPRIDAAAAALGGIDVMIAMIGETDSGIGTTQQEYYDRFLTVATKVNTDYGTEIRAVYPPYRSGRIGMTANVRPAIDNLIANNTFILFGGDTGNETINIDTDQDPSNDGLHVKTDRDVQHVGSILYSSVNDRFDSILTIVGGNEIDVALDSVYSDPEVRAADREDKDISGSVTATGSVDTSVATSYTRTFSVTDSNSNTNSETLTVNVIDQGDTVKPVLNLNGPATVSIPFGQGYSDPGAEATDNVSATTTVYSPVTITPSTAPGTYQLSYDYTDDAGNVADTIYRTVTVDEPVDSEAPVAVLNGETTVNLLVGDNFTDEGATVTDNFDDTKIIYGTGTVDTSTPGTYTLTYSTTDTAGNPSNTITRTVIVSAPAGDYDFTLPAVKAHMDSGKFNVVKDPSDREYYDVEVPPGWLGSETISSVTIVAEQGSGLTVQDPATQGNLARTLLSGGTVGSFGLEVTVTTASGRVRQRTLTLGIAER